MRQIPFFDDFHGRNKFNILVYFEKIAVSRRMRGRIIAPTEYCNSIYCMSQAHFIRRSTSDDCDLATMHRPALLSDIPARRFTVKMPAFRNQRNQYNVNFLREAITTIYRISQLHLRSFLLTCRFGERVYHVYKRRGVTPYRSHIEQSDEISGSQVFLITLPR